MYQHVWLWHDAGRVLQAARANDGPRCLPVTNTLVRCRVDDPFITDCKGRATRLLSILCRWVTVQG